MWGNRDRYGYARDVDGNTYRPQKVSVLFVAFHRSYTKQYKEYDLAILGMALDENI